MVNRKLPEPESLQDVWVSEWKAVRMMAGTKQHRWGWGRHERKQENLYIWGGAEGTKETALPSSFRFVFGHEILENIFCHFLMGGEGYFGPVLSFKTNTHWFRNLLLGLELNVMPLWCTHARPP